jgi:hypothetical protein
MPDPVGAVAAKCVNRPCASEDFTAVRNTARNKVLFPGPHRNPFSIDDQCVAALNHNHVFIIIVGMRGGSRSVTAGPKCHLTSVRSVKHVALDPWRCLIGRHNPVRSLFHEFREFVHGRTTL